MVSRVEDLTMRHDIPGMGNMADLAQAKQAEAIGGRSYNPTLRERLIAQKADLSQRLDNVENAIQALDANPNFEQVLNVIGKVNY
jgi:hypothetical protein